MQKSQSDLISFHGGVFQDLLVHDEEERKSLFEEAKNLYKLTLSSLETSDLIMLGIGAFSPLNGYLNSEDYNNVLNSMRLSNGVLWPIPITLSISKEDAEDLKTNQTVALVEPYAKSIIGIMKIREIYPYSKREETLKIFGTDDLKHPGVKKIYEQGRLHVGGEVRLFHEGGYPERFSQYARPVETRRIFRDRGWKTIAAFQTRNPIHRSHEYITKIALEMFDGLFIHPIVGKLKEGDIPAAIRMKCYQVLLNNYYPKEKVELKVYPMEMRYGGPREAVLHAIIKQNFGCTHLIIGRDHAGVGDYYGPYDAQRIFDGIREEDLKIKPFNVDLAFYCYRCGQVASKNSCPHSDKDHLLISGTELRRMLSRGERPPKYFSRPEVLDILLEYYSRKSYK